MNRKLLAAAWTAVNVSLLTGALVLLVLTLDVPWDGWGLRGGNLPAEVIIVWLGWTLTTRRPENPIGWLVLATTTHFALDEVGTYLDLFLLERGVTWTGPLAALFAAAWVPGMVLLLHAFARFPDGDLPAGWRRRAILVLGPVAIVTVSITQFSGADLGTEVAAATSGEPPGGLFLPLPLYGLCVLTTVVSRFRRSTGMRRQQFRWVAYASVPFVLGFVILPFVAAADDVGLQVSALLNTVGVTLLLAAFSVAVLRYRLYELDRIVSRTLTYVLLTGALVGVYAAGVVAVGAVVRELFGATSDTLAVAVSTLLAVALFDPFRRRLQEGIDRRLNRSRYDARRVVERFGVRIGDEVEQPAIRGHIVATLSGSVQPSFASVWTPEQRRPVDVP